MTELTPAPLSGQDVEVARAPRRQPVTPRHAKQRRRSAAPAVIGLVAGVMSVLLVSASAVGGVLFNSFNQRLQENVQVLSETHQVYSDVGAIDGGFNILVVGTDSREGTWMAETADGDHGGELNDVNILIHVAQDQSNATVISFPRDLEVDLPDCARWFGYRNKINTAYSQAGSDGGLACVVQTVENLTGLPIHFAGKVSFAGVIALADAIGGVSVCTDGPIFDPYSGLDLPSAGEHLLAGDMALAFLRTRHGVGDGSDWSRVSSQQVYLSSLLRKVKDDGTLSDPGRLFNLANIAINNMVLSSGFADPYTLVSIALTLKNLPLERVSFVQFPTSGTNDRGNAVANWAAADPLLAYVAADAPFQLSQVGDGRGSEADPNAPADPAPTATDAPAPIDNSELPVLNGVSGQTGAQYSCAVANN